MIRKALAVVGATAAVAALALAGPAQAQDDSFTSNTVRVTHAQDAGHHGVWANLEFDRTVTATDNGDGTYAVTMTDEGSFTALAGGPSPRQGTELAKGGKGTLHGTYAFTVTSATAPSSTDVPDALDEDCTSTAGQARTCANRPSNEAYVLRYFGDGATAQAGEYSWTYQQGTNAQGAACEAWVDSSANNDGSDADAGDITMVTCPAPPTSQKSFDVANSCRVRGYSLNVWTVKNLTDQPQRFHTGVEYAGRTTWFGWANRAALAPGATATVVSPNGGRLHVQLDGVDHTTDTEATAVSNHTVYCQ